MPDYTPFAAKGIAALAVLALLIGATWRARSEAGRPQALALVFGAAAISLFSWTNFGAFHALPHAAAIHHWEHFHYQLGSKFFPEVGYDGLYAASVAAQRKLAPNIAPEPYIRDLRDYDYEATATPGEHEREVRARFAPERWRAFLADHREYQKVLGQGTMAAIRSDHGYNPTPLWSFVGRSATRWLGADPLSLALLASLDAALLGAAFFAIGRCFGWQTACLCAAVFGTGYGWRFYYNGGALLRFDWLAACAFGLCALERKHFAAAGACFVYAAMVRAFPAFFLIGPGIVALREWLRAAGPTAGPPRWALQLAAGAATALIVGLLLGSLAGRGPHAWIEFSEKIQLHHDTQSPGKLGVTTVTLAAPELARALAAGEAPRVWPRTTPAVEKTLSERQLLDRCLRLGLGVLLAWACWRSTRVDAAVLGLAWIFLLVPLDNYYWAMAMLVPLHRIRWAPFAVIGLSALLFALHPLLVAQPPAALLRASAQLSGAEIVEAASNSYRYALYSLALFGLFAAWAIAAARAPAAAPAADSEST